jgi:hypothetical protein
MLVACAAAVSVSGTPPAEAWDHCVAPVTAKGKRQLDIQSARMAAIGAWQKKASKLHGRRFADWWYSGDRVVSCQWNGRYSWCSTTASPCAHIGWTRK